MDDLKSLPPHLLLYYKAFFRNFNAGIRDGPPLTRATNLAWEKTLASNPLTEDEEFKMRALIGLR